MDAELRDRFTALWQNYFPGTELPITFEFRNASGDANNSLRRIAGAVSSAR